MTTLEPLKVTVMSASKRRLLESLMSAKVSTLGRRERDEFTVLLMESVKELGELAKEGSVEPTMLHYMATMRFLDKVEEYNLDMDKAKKFLRTLND